MQNTERQTPPQESTVDVTWSIIQLTALQGGINIITVISTDAPKDLSPEAQNSYQNYKTKRWNCVTVDSPITRPTFCVTGYFRSRVYKNVN